jgi:hypothetical protein
MSNDNDDLDEMNIDRLRELKQEVLSRIEATGKRIGTLDQKIDGAEEIRKYYDFLKDIEARLDVYEKGAPGRS